MIRRPCVSYHSSAGDPEVSVVIPLFNAGQTIAATLESALAQDFQSLEIVVVDDGSSDNGPDIVEALAARDRRVRLIRHEHRGANATRNAGIAAARAPLIAPLDADDLWHPEKLKLQIEALGNGGAGTGVAYGWTWFIDEQMLCIPRLYCAFSAEGWVLPAMIHNNFLSNGSNPLIRADLLRAVGGFPQDGRYGLDDTRLYLRLAERTKFVCVPRILVGYTERAQSRSQASERIWQTYLAVMAELSRDHPELPGRLFRWSRGRLAVYFATRALRRRQYRAMARFTLRALMADPMTPLILPWKRELDARLGRVPADETMAALIANQPFLPPFAELAAFVPPSHPWLTRRRLASCANLAAQAEPDVRNGIACFR